MRQTLAILALLLLAPTSAFAHAPEPMPPVGSVWTVFTEVDADVVNGHETVRVIEDIANRGPDPEFPFVVRVPDDAFVTGLTITRDGVTYAAKIMDKDAARQEYDAAKNESMTAGLVEKTRHSDLYSYLINVEGRTSVRAVLTYERYLVADRGAYNVSLEAPVPGFGRDLGARFSLHVSDVDGITDLWSDPAGARDGEHGIAYEVGPRSTDAPTLWNASFTLAPTADQGTLLTTIQNGTGYFVHRFRAPSDAPQLPMDLALVLDVSGSMSGMKIQQLIDSAKQVVGALGPEDRLHLVAFSSDARASWTGMRAMGVENKSDAARAIDGLFAGGGTNIEAGLRDGFRAIDSMTWSLEEGRFPALVILTDGQPTEGTTSHEGLRSLAKDANDHGVNVFGIAFGEDADWTLIRSLAADGNGAAIRVPIGQGAEVDLRRFMAALTTPVLRDVRVDYSDGVRAYHPGAPVLFAGSELLVVGTFDPARGIRGTVTGIAPSGERRYTFEGAPSSIELPDIARTVGYEQVRLLQDDDAPNAAAIKEIALQFGFVTDFTSLELDLPARVWQPVMAEDSCMGCSRSTTAGATMPYAPAAGPAHGSADAYQVVASNAGASTADPGQPSPPVATSPIADPSGDTAAKVPAPPAILAVALVAAIALLLRRR